MVPPPLAGLADAGSFPKAPRRGTGRLPGPGPPRPELPGSRAAGRSSAGKHRWPRGTHKTMRTPPLGDSCLCRFKSLLLYPFSLWHPFRSPAFSLSSNAGRMGPGPGPQSPPPPGALRRRGPLPPLGPDVPSPPLLSASCASRPVASLLTQIPAAFLCCAPPFSARTRLPAPRQSRSRAAGPRQARASRGGRGASPGRAVGGPSPLSPLFPRPAFLRALPLPSARAFPVPGAASFAPGSRSHGRRGEGETGVGSGNERRIRAWPGGAWVPGPEGREEGKVEKRKAGERRGERGGAAGLGP